MFRTLEACSNAVTWCWACMDHLPGHSFRALRTRIVGTPRCSVALPKELLPIVLAHFREDRKTLLSCTYVNHLFHDEANRVLWGHLSLRHGPEIKRAYYGLTILIDPRISVIDRRPLVKTIEITGVRNRGKEAVPSPEDYDRLVYNLPSLKALIIENTSTHSMEFRSNYRPGARPNLETIVLKNDSALDLHPGFWEFAQPHDRLKVLRYTPSSEVLRRLEVSSDVPEHSDCSIAFEPGSMPRLETVAAPASIICRLVPGRPVKDVKIEEVLPTQRTQMVVDALRGSTAPIRRLDVKVSFAAIGQIASRLSPLEELEELIVRCSQPRKNVAAIAANWGLPSKKSTLKSLRRLTFISPDISFSSGYYKAVVASFQNRGPKLDAVLLKGTRSSYLETRTEGRWVQKEIDGKEMIL
ncbi:hypothetical protein FRB90_002360 [Tulasnella sp. 427]|nr:hypothetical protein FRB90_002360 [Tulasnella sp. 427]